MSLCLFLIVIQLIIVPWELAAITNKRPSTAEYSEGVRYFRHSSDGPSSVQLGDWETGLREAIHQSLLREGYWEPNLAERLARAQLIGRRDRATPFGDVAILARGQLYSIQAGNFMLLQDSYQNDCDDCYNPRRCERHDCQAYSPHNQEILVALWTVKRLRHRDASGSRFEIQYIVSPINSNNNQIIMRRNRFNYAIPGHVFVIRTDQTHNKHSQVINRKVPQNNFRHKVALGIDSEGYQKILYSYPGFYTSVPAHYLPPSEDTEAILYKKLLEVLSSKTSTTQKFSFYETTKPIPNPQNQLFTTAIVPTNQTTITTERNILPPKTTMKTVITYFMPDGDEILMPQSDTTTVSMPSTTSTQPTTSTKKFHSPKPITNNIFAKKTTKTITSTTVLPKTTTTTRKPTRFTTKYTTAPKTTSSSRMSPLTTKKVTSTIKSTTTSSTFNAPYSVISRPPSQTSPNTTIKPTSKPTTSPSTFKPTSYAVITKPLSQTIPSTSPNTIKPTMFSLISKPPQLTTKRINIKSTSRTTSKPTTSNTIKTTPYSKISEPSSPVSATAIKTTNAPSEPRTSSSTIKTTSEALISTPPSFTSPFTVPVNIITTTSQVHFTSISMERTTNNPDEYQTPIETSSVKPTTEIITDTITPFPATTTTEIPNEEIMTYEMSTMHPTQPMTVKLEITTQAPLTTLATQTTVADIDKTTTSSNEYTTPPNDSTKEITTTMQTTVNDSIESTTATVKDSIESTTATVKGSIESTTTEKTTTFEIPTTKLAPTTEATTTKMLTTDEALTTNVFTTTEVPTITVLTTLKPITTKITTTKSTTRKTTTPSDFLTEAEPYNGPIYVGSVKNDYSLDDIFGTTTPTTKLTTTSKVAYTESDISQQLFGGNLPQNSKIIFSNFYEASTDKNENDFSTSQSYETSISLEVNKRNLRNFTITETTTPQISAADNNTKRVNKNRLFNANRKRTHFKKFLTKDGSSNIGKKDNVTKNAHLSEADVSIPHVIEEKNVTDSPLNFTTISEQPSIAMVIEMPTNLTDFVVYKAEYPNEPTKANQTKDKDILDDLTLRLVNHAKSLEYLMKSNNTLKLPKYRRKAYVPRSKRPASKKKLK